MRFFFLNPARSAGGVVLVFSGSTAVAVGVCRVDGGSPVPPVPPAVVVRMNHDNAGPADPCEWGNNIFGCNVHSWPRICS